MLNIKVKKYGIIPRQILVPPLDFSSILGYPNEFAQVYLDEHNIIFHGHTNSTTLHVTSFRKLMLDLDVVHEDVMMKFFLTSLDDKAMHWFGDLSKK
jgi:hypothetical protein